LYYDPEYFEWLCKKVPSDFGSRKYCKLLKTLYSEEFTYSMPMDENRAIQGASLRRDYADDRFLGDYYMATEPCNVLEMMIALASICEDRIMKDDDRGNRTGRWFWDMIASIGLLDMDDEHFDEQIVRDKIHTMLNRKYKSNGMGGLFTIPSTTIDLRSVDIWYQAQWYLAECLHQNPLQLKGE